MLPHSAALDLPPALVEWVTMLVIDAMALLHVSVRMAEEVPWA
ncbi:hypothetical protein [Streptomyces phaeolivaceus]|nr:hypothetical protein [Streptomyces phaeolivaceus]